MNRRTWIQLLGVGGAVSLAGCGSAGSSTVTAEITDEHLTLATATTVHDSGLLTELITGFQREFGAAVDAIARGSGAALETARNGDCDIVLVHARPLEDAFLRDGYGVNRRAVMVNDFLVVGPPDDPAGVAGLGPVAAFEAIATADAPFVSRGDRSGTHLRERRLWSETSIDPDGSWYTETGQGMGDTLVIAEQAEAYTLCDRGTFLNVAEDQLVAYVEGGIEDPPPLLRNEYGVIPVNPARREVAYRLGMAFVGYLTGAGQTRIDGFRIGGEQAFRSMSSSEISAFEQYVPRDWKQNSA
ncbi:substrate-binding domain-containing protein [Halorubrum halophilum]|uniref:substrate-binding domain-containing protein n=1 Tax=Halorubrum halophilum TaxID=413816 RepID=UPI000678600C|nr:substrate-binding domain-containing protein [Halorubrum halophilum]